MIKYSTNKYTALNHKSIWKSIISDWPSWYKNKSETTLRLLKDILKMQLSWWTTENLRFFMVWGLSNLLLTYFFLKNMQSGINGFSTSPQSHEVSYSNDLYSLTRKRISLPTFIFSLCQYNCQWIFLTLTVLCISEW